MQMIQETVEDRCQFVRIVTESVAAIMGIGPAIVEKWERGEGGRCGAGMRGSGESHAAAVWGNGGGAVVAHVRMVRSIRYRRGASGPDVRGMGAAVARLGGRG